MSRHKASRFINVAEANGWTCKWRQQENFAFVQVTATRGPESMDISWEQNQLNGPPLYKFHDMERKLHSRKVAEGVLQRAKPDLDQYKRHQRSAGVANRAPAAPAAMSSGEPEVVYELPFDPDNDPDSVILKAIRGNVIVWRNSVSGAVESCLVPWRISTKSGVKIMNADTENVFYLATASNDSDYLSFMDVEGRFRSVHLKSLIGVM